MKYVYLTLLAALVAVALVVWLWAAPGRHRRRRDGGDKRRVVPSDWNGKTASTTMFGFGSSTACVCNGQKITEELLPLGWVGCATPDWMLTPFLDMKGATATSKDTPAQVKGEKYFSNCGVGAGGGSTCWELTTTGEPNVYGDKSVPAGITMRAVVVDACEDRNAYGNNTQWCIAARGVPKGGVVESDVAKAARYLKPGKFVSDAGKAMRWENDACWEDGTWRCTNLAGQPAHFDIAMASLTDAQVEALKGWKKGTNPVVKIRKVECPATVTEVLRSNCGQNAAPGEFGRCFWCPQDPAANQGAKGSLPSEIPSWWGGCGANEQRPECAEIYGECGQHGKPDCCQWGFECKGNADGWKSCKRS